MFDDGPECFLPIPTEGHALDRQAAQVDLDPLAGLKHLRARTVRKLIPRVARVFGHYGLAGDTTKATAAIGALVGTMARANFDQRFGGDFLAGVPLEPGIYRLYHAAGPLTSARLAISDRASPSTGRPVGRRRIARVECW